ncbi:hypothetical protein [uncultured Fusobacterium sp.]|uniref:hypothetical protein n=1 Tax=uncultured Fusobacterium sp. TaxID=159267 RepID=UPI0027DC3B7E|nr:hypothetical protein [uncultured Fusobacterium sp.]
MNLVQEVIEGLPLQYQKNTNIKFFISLEPVIEYINNLIEEFRGQTSLYKTKGIFLDFMGERFKEKRNRRNDEEYRKALVSKEMAVAGLPTTEFLLDIARKLSGAKIVDFQTRYKGEVASQYFRANAVEKFDKIKLFPNLNKICEAGAKMYWELQIIDENALYNFGSIIDMGKKIEIEGDFEIDQTININQNLNFMSIIAITKKIEVKK